MIVAGEHLRIRSLLAEGDTEAYILPAIFNKGRGMPIKEGKRYCVNHPNARMNRTETLKALVAIKGTGSEATVNPSSGLIVMPFVCEECGYLELYVADKTQNEKK